MKKAALLITAALLCVLLPACGKAKPENTKETTTLIPPPVTNTQQSLVTQLGSGKTGFYFTVNDGVENSNEFYIHTDEKTVGDALEKIGMIYGTDGKYVTVVNGYKADYNVQGLHWTLYINGKQSTENVKSIQITENAEYMFRAEK